MFESALAGSLAALISSVGVYFAHRAAKNTKPVSNGFANKVLEDLHYLRGAFDEHLRNHK